MKNLILCVCAILFAIGLNAQEKRKEVSVNFTSLNEFGLSYKSGTAKSLWRYHLLNIYAGINDSENESNTNENTNYGIGITLGKEFRKPVTDHLEFRYGFDIGANYASYKNISKTNNPIEFENKFTYFVPRINGVIGVNYIFNKNIAFGIELLPGISYATTTGKNINNDIESKTETSSFNFNLSNNNARISLAYRF